MPAIKYHLSDSAVLSKGKISQISHECESQFIYLCVFLIKENFAFKLQITRIYVFIKVASKNCKVKLQITRIYK